MTILDSIELFNSLTDSERETLALYCQERFIRSGEILFHEGDSAIALYIVKSGILEAYKHRSNGETILGEIMTGELAGEMALFDPTAPKIRIANVRAIEDSLLLIIMDYAILELSKKHPEIYAKITQIIMKRKSLDL